MTLVEKLDNIAKTSTVESLKEYPDVETAKDFDELWDKVIEPNLPSKDTVEKWHKLLMKYVQHEDAIFSLRACASGEHPRRGCLNQVFVNGKKTFGTFCTDNGIPTYIYAMAKDEFVPELTEFNEMMIHNCNFPFGWNVTSEEKQIAAYPKGKNPGISDKGFKLAHIFPAGKEYRDDAGYKTITKFWQAEFPKGDISDWKQNTLANGKYYRPISIGDESRAKKVRSFAVAHFLRSVHPLNFFLVPNKPNTRDGESGILKTNIYYKDHTGKEKDEIGEYAELIEYVAVKIKDRHKDTNIYQEFLDLVFPMDNRSVTKNNNVQIAAEYAIGIWKRNIGGGQIAENGSKNQKKAKQGAMKTKSVNTPKRNDNKTVVLNLLNDACSRNLIDIQMLKKLTDRSYTSIIFGISTYPLLVKKADFVATGFPTNKYYNPEIITIHGEEYRICSQWTSKAIDKLKNWYSNL